MHFMFHGWTGTCDLEKTGGLILKNVKHDGFKLAADIRVTRVWVGKDPGNPADWLPFVLGGAELPAVEEKIFENREDDPKNPYLTAPKLHLLANYPRAGELSTNFNTPGAVFKIAGESSSLFVTQRYLFTKYSTTPSHEPFGTLRAARLYPLLQFRYDPIDPNAPSDKTPPRLIRVDHRMEFHIDAPTTVGGLTIDVNPTGRSQTALIQDPDTRPRVIDGLFPAGEKPVGQECIGDGIRYNTGANRTDAGDWDNIHVWGGYTDKTGAPLLPPTPGVNNGVHIHWRWGKFMASGSTGVIDMPGGPQFAQPTAPGTPAPTTNAGRPLIDYRLPHQSMRFAMTAPSANFEAKLNPSERDFDSLFTGSSPRGIGGGARTIIIWMSHYIQIPLADRYPSRWEGTVMLPGLYFAHNPEELVRRLWLVGSTDQVSKSTRSGPYGWICKPR